MPARTGCRRFGFTLLLALAAGSAQAVASEWAAIEGVILDENRAPLPGVTVVASSERLATGERGTTTDSAGRYRITSLPPGRGYRLRATLPGYALIEFTDLTLTAGKTSVQDMQLRPASELQERVRVSGRSDTVDTETVTTSTSFSANFIGELPVFGRDYQEILTLAPGVTDVDKTGNPNIHGARGTDVITLVDGVSTTDPFTGYFGQQLNIESIQEVEVITAGAPADYSRAQGGFANIITKSGGNEFEGTFKLFIRSSRVDGDGAGVDPPDLTGFAGASSAREMSFTDLKPYLSVSGAFVRDRLWYYLSSEYIQEETPVNAVTQSYVTRTTGLREFGKLTWQATPAQKAAFSVIFDRTQDEDQGLGSFTAVESGYTFRRGGPTYTLKHSSVPKPNLVFETSASWFDNRFQVIPSLDADTNGNGALFFDYDRDGILEANERDPGEDYDVDGAYDVYEAPFSSRLDPGEDLDSDGHRTTQFGCEGSGHEDLNCNGVLDHEVDLNQDGYPDPEEDTGLLLPCTQSSYGYCLGASRPVAPGTSGNGRFDTEDANANAQLDVVGDSGQTPYPFWNDANGNGIPDAGEYRRPQAADRDYLQDPYGRTSGPYPYSHDDHRSRLTLREDTSTYVGDLFGTHDLRMGAVYEKEGYAGDTEIRPTLFGTGLRTLVKPDHTRTQVPSGFLGFFAIPPSAAPTADGDNFGIYFQDTYKPVPNLALGVGLRVDVERLTSTGYTPFDPAAERGAYDQLMSAAGADTNPYDLLGTTGLCGDPLADCQGSSPTNLYISQVFSQLKASAPKRLARHQLSTALVSPFLSRLLGRTPTAADFLASGINPRQPETVELENRNLAPRLSVSWDPWGDGKTKGFLSWGRYYDKLFLQSLALEQGPDQLSRYYTFDLDGMNSQNGNPDHQIGPVISTSPASITSVDRDLSTPYSDELTLGFEREIAPEVSVRLTYIRRDYRDQLQDVDLNHYQTLDPATGRSRDAIGRVDCGSGGSDVPLGGNQCVAVADGLPDLYVQNFFFNRIFHLGNSNAQAYRGYELELVRRLSRKWQLEGSYTYSEATGDAESYLSESGDDPSLVEYEHGYLSYDQRHVVKLNAVAYLPGDWRLGGSAQWSSGLPYSEVFNGRALDDAGYAQARVVYGSIDQNAGGLVREGRNIHRNLAAYLFNVRVQKNFVLGKASASGFLEVYNLLNADTLRIYQVEWLTGEMTDTVQRSIGTRDFGRRFQFGFQVYF